MREKLDYEVEYVIVPGTTAMYEGIRNGIADVSFVTWPANYEDTFRASALASRTEQSSTGRTVEVLGALKTDLL